MRKLLTILLSVFILISISSCCFLVPEENYSKVLSRTDIGSFEHLERPIVFTMPLVGYYDLFGNPKSSIYKEKELGHVFVIYDCQKDIVYDYASFPGEHGFHNWRSIELSPDGKQINYYDSGWTSQKIGCLNSKTGRVDIIPYSNDYISLFNGFTNDVPVLPRYGLLLSNTVTDEGIEDYQIRIFDSVTNNLKPMISLPMESVSMISQPRVDPTGVYYIMWEKAHELNGGNNYNYYRLTGIDCENNRFLDKEFTISFRNKDDDDYYKSDVCYVDDEYIYISKGIGEQDPSTIKLVVVKRDTLEIVNTISQPKDDNKYYLYTVVKINGKIYGVFPAYNLREHKTYILDIDLENNQMGKKDYIEMNIDMTETVYVRGSKLYLMSSRNQTNVYLMFHDFVTNENSDIININLSDVVGWK